MDREISRRIFGALLAASALPGQTPGTRSKGRSKPVLPRAGEFVRFVDALTENIVVRLTAPSSASFLPASGRRFMSSRERFLLFASDRTGVLSPHSMDLRSGLATQLAQTSKLQPGALELGASGRAAYLLDGTTLKEIALPSLKSRDLFTDVTAFSASGPNGLLAFIRSGKLERSDAPGRAWADDVSEYCSLRPDGGGCLFTRLGRKDELWYVGFATNAEPKPLLLTDRAFSNPCWSPDGQSVLLLRDVPLAGGLSTSEVHEIPLPLDPGAPDRLVSRTSRFAAFAPNGDGSVYVGASRSRAQPSIVLLLRSARRELMLCEHRATNPAEVRPSFSPDSRRVYFQSDFQGKPAIYAVNVELLVEPTAS